MTNSECKIDKQYFESNDITFIMNSQSEFVDIYATIPELLFLHRDELIGKKVNDVIPGELGERFHQFCQKILETKKSSVIEYKLSTPGGYKWFFAFAKYITKEDIPFVLVECNDVDDIKFKEAKRNDNFKQIELFCFYIFLEVVK